jgi:hypothetical protein
MLLSSIRDVGNASILRSRSASHMHIGNTTAHTIPPQRWLYYVYDEQRPADCCVPSKHEREGIRGTKSGQVPRPVESCRKCLFGLQENTRLLGRLRSSGLWYVRSVEGRIPEHVGVVDAAVCTDVYRVSRATATVIPRLRLVGEGEFFARVHPSC